MKYPYNYLFLAAVHEGKRKYSKICMFCPVGFKRPGAAAYPDEGAAS
jgi:hypothetical protein